MFDRLSFDSDRLTLQNRTEIYSMAVHNVLFDPGKEGCLPIFTRIFVWVSESDCCVMSITNRTIYEPIFGKSDEKTFIDPVCSD